MTDTGATHPMRGPQVSSLLLVCLGNICRSPLAEGILRSKAAAQGLALRLDSVGTGDWHVGEPPDPRTVAVARRHGLDISGLRARQLRAADFSDFGLILCADRSVLAEVHRRAPARATVHSALLLDWAGIDRNGDVPDPYTGGAEEFLAVYRLLERAADGVLARLTRDARHNSL